MKIVDLSQDIYEGMKVYPGHLKTVQFEHATHEETAPRFEGGFSFQTTGFMLNDNGPTHVRLLLPPRPRSRRRRPSTRCRWTCSTGPRCAWTSPDSRRGTDITAEDLDRIEAASRPSTCSRATSCCSTPARGTSYAGDKRYLWISPDWGVGQRVDRAAAGQDVRRRQPDPGQPDQHQLPVPHDVPPRAHHPLREPRQPGPGREHAVHLRRVPAQADRGATAARPGPWHWSARACPVDHENAPRRPGARGRPGAPPGRRPADRPTMPSVTSPAPSVTSRFSGCGVLPHRAGRAPQPLNSGDAEGTFTGHQRRS